MKIEYAVFTLIGVLSLIACNSENESHVTLETSPTMNLSAACHTDTLRFKADESWQAECDAEWITLSSTEGCGDGILPIYIQQNDDDVSREGVIVIRNSHSKVSVTINQSDNDNNGSPIINLAKDCGLGWGYDLNEDYADIAGIRGQIFDAAALKNDYGSEAIRIDAHASTNMCFEKAQSSTQLQSEIGGKVSGEVDIKVAKAKVSVEYNKQINEQKDRLYVWCRDARIVKLSYFGNDVSLTDRDVLKWCTTSSFRKSVKNDKVEDIVRKFGTHVVTSSYLGGKLDYYFTVSQDIKTEIEKVVTTINVKILFFKSSSTTVDEKTWTEIKKISKGTLS